MKAYLNRPKSASEGLAWLDDDLAVADHVVRRHLFVVGHGPTPDVAVAARDHGGLDSVVADERARAVEDAIHHEEARRCANHIERARSDACERDTDPAAEPECLRRFGRAPR